MNFPVTAVTENHNPPGQIFPAGNLNGAYNSLSFHSPLQFSGMNRVPFSLFFSVASAWPWVGLQKKLETREQLEIDSFYSSSRDRLEKR
jgi:hypothetical protein